MQHDPELREKLTLLLGTRTYDKDDRLDRVFVAKKLFADEFLLQSLNAIVHPAVHRDAAHWHAAQSDVPYTLKEAALTFESGGYLHHDFVINVACPKNVRIERIKLRDHLSTVEIEKRLARQWTEEQRATLADFTIINDGKQLLVPQVMEVHQILNTRT